MTLVTGQPEGPVMRHDEMSTFYIIMYIGSVTMKCS